MVIVRIALSMASVGHQSGEAQEGQIWEAAFVAARYGLDNLIGILDNNKVQLYGWQHPEPQCPMDDPAAKFKSFGWHVIEVLERGERELSPADYSQAQRAALSEWIANAREAAEIQDLWSPEKAPPDPFLQEQF